MSILEFRPTLSHRARALATLSGLALLAGCAALPSSGPTSGQIRHGVKEENPLGFKIVDIDGPLVNDVNARDAASDTAAPTLSSLARDGRNDVVGPGDVLSIGIYEVGITLFGAPSGTSNADARPETFPSVVVDANGAIRLPYVGRLEVAGHTTGEIQTMIERGLRGKSQSPQALVTLRNNVSSSVYLSGDVRTPGRFGLTVQRERLLDAIALSGGPTATAEDTVVRFSRGDRWVEERLSRIRIGAADDLVLTPGDHVELIRRPRSFIALGATQRVSQITFDTRDLSLAEAVARAGGPNDAVADPTAVYLFRYDPAGPDGHEAPVIYRLDMMEPASYFLAQRFAVRDKDVIYVANAAANRPTKMVNILNQLFAPFVTARAVLK